MSKPPLSPPEQHPLPAWHFPFGPSTKYHTRERARPLHARSNSAYTFSAPSLSTERRAHRRAHTQRSSVSSLPSPPGSDLSRSPLSRFASNSISSAERRSLATINMTSRNAAIPTTPAKKHRRTPSLQNASPFSDYYTDDARSDDTDLPSSYTKQLLVRMNKLQSQLMRDHPSEREHNYQAIRIVGNKLSEIELELNSLHSQTRLPIEVEDSIGEDRRDASHAKGSNQRVPEPYLYPGSIELQPEPVTIEQFRAERDWFILRMQELLSGLNTARTELSQRFAEVHKLNERHSAELEERETELEQLRSENEFLRSESGFEYSELLFLKLQMKSLEVDIDAMSDSPLVSETTAMKEQRAKKNCILSEMDRWRADWQDVHGRFQRRRSKYCMLSPDRRDSVSQDRYPANGDDVEWHLETIKEGKGRVTSLTIKRMDSSYGNTPIEGPNDDRLADSTLGESLYGTAKKSMPLEASIDLSASTANRITSAAEAKPQGLDGQAISTNRGQSEPQIARSYMHHGTQTEHQEELSPPLPQDEEGDEEEQEDGLFPDEEGNISLRRTQTSHSDEDCAITTSSEASDTDDVQGPYNVEEHEEDLDETAYLEPAKTAWQELWSSLANLSGMGDERFED